MYELVNYFEPIENFQIHQRSKDKFLTIPSLNLEISCKEDMVFIGKLTTCSICGKKGEISKQRIEIINNNRFVDVLS
jgi:hypothetical protein